MATAIEYGLIAALIGTAIVLGVTAVGDGLNETFGDVFAEAPAPAQAEPHGIRMVGATGDTSGTLAISLGGCDTGYTLVEIGDGTADVSCKDPVHAGPLPPPTSP